MTTHPTDLESENIQQVQEPGSPEQSACRDDNAKNTDTRENEVQEKNEKKNKEKKEEEKEEEEKEEEKKDEARENVYEVIVEKSAWAN